MKENEQKKKRQRKRQKTSILPYTPTKTDKLPTYNYNKKPDYRDSGRSRPMENKRTGGGECRAGTGSPRKTFALARWMQHEIIPYQRQISADGSKPRAEARAWASFLVNLIVSLAQTRVSRTKVRKNQMDEAFYESADQTLDVQNFSC